jgi:predicted esterase YcpF (UPF0227 family)
MIAYLHGFNSGHDPQNVKIFALRKIDKDVIGIQYDSFATREVVIAHIVEVLRDYADDLTIVGTSLGGYYAAEVARILCTPVVLINPCVNPHAHFCKRNLDDVYTNYVTGQNNTLTSETVKSFDGYRIATTGYAYTPLVLLADGDEVFESRRTASELIDFEVVRFRDGSHRFEQIDEALSFIEGYVNICRTVSDLNS